jgi:hypothetical protein
MKPAQALRDNNLLPDSRSFFPSLLQHSTVNRSRPQGWTIVNRSSKPISLAKPGSHLFQVGSVVCPMPPAGMPFRSFALLSTIHYRPSRTRANSITRANTRLRPSSCAFALRLQPRKRHPRCRRLGSKPSKRPFSSRSITAIRTWCSSLPQPSARRARTPQKRANCATASSASKFCSQNHWANSPRPPPRQTGQTMF